MQSVTANNPERAEVLQKLRHLVNLWDVKAEEVADVSARVEREKAARRKIVLHQIRQMVEFWDISENELKSRGARKPPLPASSEAKYRHPVSGEAWDGVGSQPEWLKNALVKEGFLVEELRVQSAAPEAVAA